MSKTITHEGREYILKTEVDNIVSNRVSKISESRRTTQNELDEMKSRYSDMEEKYKGVQALHSQISSLQEQLSNSNQKYSRHSAIANHGITNSDVRDLVEWQYTKAMDGRPKKDKVTMGEWLQGFQEEGAQIPHTLQPYFKPTQNANPQTVSSTPAQLSSLNRTAPQTNHSVQQTSDNQTSSDMISKGTQDFEYYRKNRAKIKELYYARKGKTI